MKRFACCIISILIILLFAGCAGTGTLKEQSEKHDDIADTKIAINITPTPSVSDVELETEPTTTVQTSTQTPSDVELETESTSAVPTPTPTSSVFDVNNVKMQSTPQSSCFSEIGYDSDWQVLVVQFRDSSSVYTYSDFPEGEWSKFVSADSLGRWFNKYIKGNYEYERIS